MQPLRMSTVSFCLALGALLSGVARPSLAAVVRIDAVQATPKNDFTPNADRFGVAPFRADDSLVPHTLNIADCMAIAAAPTGARVRFTWSWIDKPFANLSPSYGVKFAPPGASCDPNSMTEVVVANDCIQVWQDRSFANSLTASGESLDIDFKGLLGSFAADPSGQSCLANVETDTKILFILSDFDGTSFTGTSLNVHVDLAPPPPPTLHAVKSGNGDLKVTWAQADASDTTVGTRV